MEYTDLQTDNGITVKMFYGCPLSIELKTQLGRSHLWKLAQIDSHKNKDIPIVIRHQDKEYFGNYLQGEPVTVASVEKEEKQLHNKIREFCPDFASDTLTFTLFSIVLIK